MPLEPTTRGKILILFTVAAFFVAMVNPSITTALVFSIASALLASSFLLSLFSLKGIICSLEVCPNGTMNERLCLPLTIANKSWRAHQGSLARTSIAFSTNKHDEFIIPPIAKRSTVVVDCFVVPRLRGLFEIRKIALVGGDPAGIFARVKKFKIDAQIKIYPETVRLESLRLQSKNKIKSSTNGRAIGISGDGQDVFGVREYRQGDPVRMIHWKASARQNRLVVKEFESLRLDRVTLLLDVDKSHVGEDDFDNNFEYLVKTAASMMRHLAGMYCQLSFISFSPDQGGAIVETGTSSGVAREAYEMLATIKPDKTRLPTLLDHALDIVPDDSILFCLSMSNDDASQKRFDELLERGVDIRWVFAPPSGFPKRNAPPSPASQRKFDFSGTHIRPRLVSNAIEIAQAIE